MAFYLRAFLILLAVSLFGIWFTWTVQMSGPGGAYVSGETLLFVLMIASVVAGLSLIPTWIAKERTTDEVALRTGGVISLVLSVLVAIPIGGLAQL